MCTIQPQLISHDHVFPAAQHLCAEADKIEAMAPGGQKSMQQMLRKKKRRRRMHSNNDRSPSVKRPSEGKGEGAGMGAQGELRKTACYFQR